MFIERFMKNFYISDKGILFENKNLKNEEYKKIDSLMKNKDLKFTNNYVSYYVDDIVSLGLGINRNVNQNEKIFDINIKYDNYDKNIKMSSLPETENLTRIKISKLAFNYNKVFNIHRLITKDLSKDITKDLSKDITKDLSKDITKDLSKDITKNNKVKLDFKIIDKKPTTSILSDLSPLGLV